MGKKTSIKCGFIHLKVNCPETVGTHKVMSSQLKYYLTCTLFFFLCKRVVMGVCKRKRSTDSCIERSHKLR